MDSTEVVATLQQVPANLTRHEEGPEMWEIKNIGISTTEYQR